MRKPATAYFVLLIALGTLVFSVLRQRIHPEEARLRKLTRSFLTCLPADLRDDQKKEVTDILDLFQRSAVRGKVAKKDRVKVLDLLTHYTKRGNITREELSLFMARVSYYTYRQTPANVTSEGEIKPPDHPLLQKPEGDTAEGAAATE